MRIGLRLCVGTLAVIGAMALAAALAFGWAGVSARPAPTRLEALVARSARDLLIPASAKGLTNPLAADEGNLSRARDHFSDHCAPCHGLDGRGETEMGRGLSPRAPDLTLPATRALSDGALFWIIENGVRLTGMPAFGAESADDDAHAWSLVHWIRRLPELTPREIEAMGREAKASGSAHERHEHEHGH